MYGWAITDSADERTTRAMRGIETMPTATITFVVLAPSTATIVRARMIVGKAKSAFTSRCSQKSTAPPKYAPTRPIKLPMVTPRPTEMKPTCSEMRAPYTTWLKISRPSSSVPKKCSALGAFRRSRALSAKGSWVAISGANAASTTSKRMSAPPTAPSGYRRIKRPIPESGLRRSDGAAIQGFADVVCAWATCGLLTYARAVTSGFCPFCGQKPEVTAAETLTSRQPNARVELCVRDVGDQVDQDKDHREQQYQRLDHREIAVRDRINQKPANAGQAEDCLNHDAAAENVAE